MENNSLFGQIQEFLKKLAQGGLAKAASILLAIIAILLIGLIAAIGEVMNSGGNVVQ